ncbi:MAG: hypothetical protein IH971_07040 [Candidatus Marinimicrobia bacterium]|nr:hypothetical protein [Candidatus Neomarinimicrobiota bacterium]
MAKRIFALSETLTELSDAELLKKGREIRWRAKSGIPLHALLMESYALVRESARRAVKIVAKNVGRNLRNSVRRK